MSFRRIESLLSTQASEQEILETIHQKSLINSFILNGEHSQYPVHTIVNVPSDSPLNIYRLSYYLSSNNLLIPYVFHNDNEAVFEDLWFKIMNIPSFAEEERNGFYDRKRRKSTRDNIIQQDIPFAALAINATPTNELVYSVFSHNEGYTASEALAKIQESAVNQLRYYNNQFVTVPDWKDTML